MAQKKTNNSNVAKLAVLGASVAGLAATAYFFLGPKGKKNQKHAKAWAIKMKGDVVEKLENAKEVTEPIYHSIVDAVAQKYAKNAKIGKEEIDLLAKNLKSHWKAINPTAKTKKKVVKKVSK